jgi:hypothetical protein
MEVGEFHFASISCTFGAKNNHSYLKIYSIIYYYKKTYQSTEKNIGNIAKCNNVLSPLNKNNANPIRNIILETAQGLKKSHSINLTFNFKK